MSLNEVLTLSVDLRGRHGVVGMSSIVAEQRWVRGGRGAGAGIEIEQAFRGSNGELFRGAHDGRREWPGDAAQATTPPAACVPARALPLGRGAHSCEPRTAHCLRNGRAPPHSIHNGALLQEPRACDCRSPGPRLLLLTAFVFQE